MTNILVLGAGMVGRAMALDLVKDYFVTSVDFDENNLAELKSQDKLTTKICDFNNKNALKQLVIDYDLIIGAAPGFMGFEVLKTVLECGKDMVDISFFPENPFDLNELAIKNNVTAIVDCGVAPGMSNLIAGYYNKRMQISNLECYVGGLPMERKFPFQYKAPFSPVDVIEEYMRPARYVQNGMVITKAALSEPEIINFEGIGSLEAFNTDGLRTLISTMQIPDMKEKTLRYPGHIHYIEVLKSAGFFDSKPIDFNGNLISPLYFTSKILFNKWKLQPDEHEFTVMRVIVEGFEGEKHKIITYHLFDYYDDLTKTSSMARTTGYTATAVANLLIQNKYSRKGIIPPEFIGEDEDSFEFIFDYLSKRNVNWIKEIK
jgi:lysine 6-dehydrogenase